jgi:molybdopterin molybdotransferase
LQAGQIYDSNRFTLRGLFIQAGCEVVDLGIVADHPRALENTFEAAKACDLIVSTGGVSVGEADFVRQVLQQQGTLHAWKVAMKPGRPLTVGQLAEHALYFGLPGNPVSGMITFYLFVAMALRALHGRSKYTPVTMSAVCSNTLKKMPGRVEYQRGILYRDLDQRWSVKTTGRQDSHVLTSMHEANCLIVLGIDSDGAQCGERVEVIPYSELRAVLDA